MTDKVLNIESCHRIEKVASVTVDKNIVTLASASVWLASLTFFDIEILIANVKSIVLMLYTLQSRLAS
jgi:predicted methyltransferase